MTNIALLQQADLLAKRYSFDYLKEKQEMWEDFYDYYTSEIYDPVNAKDAFDYMTTYLIAMSYKELDFSKKCDHDTIDIGDSEHSVTACTKCEKILN